MEDDFLAHYGVRGMKWGVHNAETAARYGEAKSAASMSNKKAIGVTIAAIAGATAVAATNPVVLAAGASAVSKVAGIAAPLVARKAMHSVGNYIGTKAINTAAKKVAPVVRNKKTKKLLNELSEHTVTEVAVARGKKALQKVLYT